MVEVKKPILVQNGRFYFSYDFDGLLKRFKKWKTMGIPVEFLSEEDLKQKTILRLDPKRKIYAFGMFGNKENDIPPDGYAKPHIMETTIL